MSYCVKLQENNKTVELNCSVVDSGINLDLNGSMFLAETDITFNLCEYFKQVFGEEGLRYLYGKKAKDCIDLLNFGVLLFGSKKEGKDIWARTAGNAGYFLNELLKWAKEYPEAIFKVY